jgi:hypothetical protein
LRKQQREAGSKDTRPNRRQRLGLIDAIDRHIAQSSQSKVELFIFTRN